MLKTTKYLFEYTLVILLQNILVLIGIDKASAFGSWVGINLGKYFKANKIAQENIKLVFPHFSKDKIESTRLKMWDNLGRMVAESMCMSQMSEKQLSKIITIKNAPKQKSFIVVSGHFGNFEIASSVSKLVKIKTHFIYRNTNNAFINKLIVKQRESPYVTLHKKGKAGLREIINVASQRKEAIAMLIDQKTNNGITVPFLGHDAKTTPLPATLSKKYNLPVCAIFMKRIKKAKFEVTFTDMINFKEPQTKEEIMIQLNNIIEEEIIKSPEQWFWVHNRWK